METPLIDLNQNIWTYQDYRELPNNGKTYQVIGGRLFTTPAPSPLHQDISGNLGFIIRSFVKEHNLGKVYNAPVDVVFNSVNVVQSDIIFISQKRLRIIKEKGIFGAPDWIIEIISPSSDKIDIKLKKGLYEHFRVREYWIVYPDEEKVEVYLLKEGKFKLRGTFSKNEPVEVNVIENFKIDLKEIFPPDSPGIILLSSYMFFQKLKCQMWRPDPLRNVYSAFIRFFLCSLRAMLKNTTEKAKRADILREVG